KQCMTSFLEKTDPEYTTKERLEFVIVDNGSCSEKKAEIEAEIEAFRLETEVGITYLYEPMEFNFSAMCNKGVKASRGEYVLLLNDDIEILEKNWLKVMLGQALLPGTGAVGAKLWYPDGERIQHAGITNMHIGPSHKLVTFPDDRSYYYGHNSLPYDMIAVTAACLLVRKDLYLEVSGLDETMKVAYNDVDFCFKLYEAGYRNVQRNDAVLCHHESVSRGLDEDSEEKWDRLLTEKSRLYEKHPGLKSFDPYYSEQLADNAPDYRIGYLHPFEQPFLTATPVWEKDLSFLKAHESSRVMLTVERAGKQNKLHQEEPDVFFIEGWCYMLGGENSQYERWVILENEDGYARLNVQDRNRPDVTAILSKEKEIELAGFTCRILKEDLINSNHLKVGMLYRNLLNGKYYYRSSDKSFCI
ncbi:MAG: glycosyltransferase family 2 protein, partial [Lachnospiraceae bacterium]